MVSALVRSRCVYLMQIEDSLQQCQSIMYLYTILFTYSTFYTIQIHFNTKRTNQFISLAEHGVSSKSVLDLHKIPTGT